MNALLSLYDKNGADEFARELNKRGFNIISSGGTAKYLLERRVSVTDVSTLTGFPPVLGHRVVTLAPQIHGPLLAKPEMADELAKLNWPKIHLLYVTFYPLEEELRNPKATLDSCIEKTDIGGPTMVRSANKGGEVIVMTHRDDELKVLRWLDQGQPDKKKFLFGLRAKAELAVTAYIHHSAEVYQRFAQENGYAGRTDFPRYLMKVGGKHQFVPIHIAGRLYDSGQVEVEIGDLVLERDLSTRSITSRERCRISEIADEYGASK